MVYSVETIDGVVDEIVRIHMSLPARPSIDDVEAATVSIHHLEKEEQNRVDAISNQKKGFEIPDELFSILQQMQRLIVSFQCKELKREALNLLELENAHVRYDELIQRASACLPQTTTGPVSLSARPASSMNWSRSTTSISNSVCSSLIAQNGTEKELARSSEWIIRDDSYVKKPKPAIDDDESICRPAAISEERNGKLSLIKLASLIEVSAKNGTRDLNLQSKLMDQVSWIPDTVQKLLDLVTLNLSENRLIALPTTISALSSLTKLDVHSNSITALPDTIGDLTNLVHLYLSGNQLTSLPSTIGKLRRLEELDLSSNQLTFLPDVIGELVNLKKLNVETNNLEEFPYTIGNCTSLVELRADYNRLKALPEAIGKLESLQVLTFRYNNIKGFPTTIAYLSQLKEVNASFNELESIQESFCLATSLTKLNIASNFANLQSLPRSIGNLEMLQELDISNNQIKVLPDSFRMLSRLNVLRAEENPLEVPPRQIAEKGAQAVVNYMADFVGNRDAVSEETKNKNIWSECCFFTSPNKGKGAGGDYAS